MSSVEPDNNDFQEHSSTNQDLMPLKDQVSSGRCKTPDYKNISREGRQSQDIQFSGCI